jgi:hypothetical protein
LNLSLLFFTSTKHTIKRGEQGLQPHPTPSSTPTCIYN